ncbi:universal stress protein [uncultured Kocuria sp.]|uniref:universal stress protein n=1 Tax=uncultured Kocuria sp. TaxID=259305 RepID=UPI00260D1EB4|nr:universal stress protein [uncultured Kocuria sp.]
MPIITIQRSSRDDAAALAAAQDLSRERDELLVVLATGSGSDAPTASGLEARAFEDQLKRQIDAKTQWRAELISPGRDHIEALVDRVRILKPSTVVIGMHHRSTVGKLLFGHDLQRLILDIEVPILLVKPQA